MNAMRRNLDIATKLGCLDKEGLEKMRHGRAPTIRKGRYQGDQLSVGHIIPRAAIPGLDHVIANLELMPLRMNEAKNDKLGPRASAHSPMSCAVPASFVKGSRQSAAGTGAYSRQIRSPCRYQFLGLIPDGPELSRPKPFPWQTMRAERTAGRHLQDW